MTATANSAAGGHADEGHYDALRRHARDHFPVQDFTHAWSAQQYSAADGLPYIGPSGHANLLIATGFGADGLTWGTVAARVIDDLVAGRENAAIERLMPRRFTPVKSAKGWLAENRVVLEHLLHRLSPASARDLSDLDSGGVAASRSTGTTARPTARPRANSTWSRRHAPTSNARCSGTRGPPVGIVPARAAASGRRQRDRGPCPAAAAAGRPRPSRSRACVKPGDGSADLRSVG